MNSTKDILRSSQVMSLALGQTIRLTHDCSVSGKSKNFSVTRDKHGLVYNCFKCGVAGKHRITGMPTVSPRARPSRVYKIPAAATPEVARWRRPVAEWVRKYLKDTEVLDHGLCSYEYDLFIPIHGSTFLMRNFTPGYEGPKWIKRGDFRHYKVGGPNDACITVVEDCISAICMAEYTDSVALMCTNLSDATLDMIIQSKYKKAVVWLDDDNTIVRKAQNKIKDRLSLVVPEVKVVRCGTDPKNINRSELWMYI